ncbi:hypothetical membrane protein [Rhodococcus rhodochrous]|uniref:hypothetical protein n=1 Tax=Rhodococcus rhodochrous TaxID=1829 RepID=UPI0007510970|nr:hypothetical protein [Rhodococcus rhodochrous]AYA26519.1 hypothetical protein C6369_020145 [Rhodococcus rhodochrous]MCD2100041.1 hypothetical protein [Rhodococcus rhodochrous]MCD2124425.1 hypothetical protein [Rhodococcus rhodochrous]MCQ4137281.1 hypothetical protein [Rhodococcus rhodochrous]MDJ0021115.1 hypothetical protein [Rhodococcus rhodochrous]
MAAGFDFSWAQFLWIVLIFVGVPTLIGVSMVWVAWQRERAGVRSPSSDHEQTGDRPVGLGLRGLWATGATAFALGFLSCAGWLSWSAEHDGEFRGPGLPAPNEFPTWQVIACGVTVVLACFLCARRSRWVVSGGLAAAIGTAAGFTTAFSVVASTDDTGQAGVGVMLSEIGWGIGLCLLMLVRAARIRGARRRAVGAS